MELKYQTQIDSIENCPLANQYGSLILYRCVENPITPNSIEVHAVLHKPKYHDICQAWGLSFFRDVNAAKEMLRNLSKKKQKQVNVQAIASCLITDNDGIKYATNNKKHYTFFPKVDLDLIDRFTLIEINE